MINPDTRELLCSGETSALLSRLGPVVSVLALDADNDLDSIQKARVELQHMHTLGILAPTDYMLSMDRIGAWQLFLAKYAEVVKAAVAVQAAHKAADVRGRRG